MKKIINNLHKSEVMGKIFHTLDYCLQNELRNCETVLDLGCGPSSPIQFCKNIKRSVGVEIFKPYYETAKKNNTHTELVNKKIVDLDFPNNSFDAVILIEVLEHLSEAEGKEIMRKAQKWAKKKVVISSPNGFIHQKEVDNNPWQRHLSGWDNAKMKKLGFKTHGLAGVKSLRQEVENDTMGDDITTSIRFRPKFFWFIVATLSQIITYYFPNNAFELFSVKVNDID